LRPVYCRLISLNNYHRQGAAYLVEAPENSPVGSIDYFELVGSNLVVDYQTMDITVIKGDLLVHKHHATLPDGDIVEKDYVWMDVTVKVDGFIEYNVIDAGTLTVDLPVFQSAPNQDFDILGIVHLTW